MTEAHTGWDSPTDKRVDVDSGASHNTKRIDGTLMALGAGAGNSPTEDVVKPFITRMPVMDRASIMQGYAGVYSSFLIHAERAAERAAERYGAPAYQILEEIGKAGYVGGQKHMIVDVAVQLANVH